MSQVGTLFDDSGIVVRFMNSMTEGNGIRDAGSANALLQQARFLPLTARDPSPCAVRHIILSVKGWPRLRSEYKLCLHWEDLSMRPASDAGNRVKHAACRFSIVA